MTRWERKEQFPPKFLCFAVTSPVDSNGQERSSSDKKKKSTNFEKIRDEENVQNYIYIYIYNKVTYLCTTRLNNCGNYGGQQFPFSHGLQTKEDSMRMERETHNYLQLQGGPGLWEPCSRCPFPSSLVVSPRWDSQDRGHTFLDCCQQASGGQIGICEVMGSENEGTAAS